MALTNGKHRELFGISEGPPLHDPLAVAAVLAGTSDDVGFTYWDSERSQGSEHEERFDVTIVTEGTYEAAKEDGSGVQTGRTIIKEAPAGQSGVRIPRSVDVAKFWNVMEECTERADGHI